MRNHPIIVQKYGGVCLETPAKIRAVARSLAALHGRGYRVVAIVSAMGKTTDQLIQMAYQVSPAPNRRELDMLLTTGERISMSLMSMALSDLGVPAISFTGSQAGVIVFDVLVGSESRVGFAVGKRGLPSRSSRAAPAFAQVGFGVAAFTRFASEGCGPAGLEPATRPL
jgi:hypothetical protein